MGPFEEQIENLSGNTNQNIIAEARQTTIRFSETRQTKELDEYYAARSGKRFRGPLHYRSEGSQVDGYYRKEENVSRDGIEFHYVGPNPDEVKELYDTMFR